MSMRTRTRKTVSVMRKMAAIMFSFALVFGTVPMVPANASSGADDSAVEQTASSATQTDQTSSGTEKATVDDTESAPSSDADTTDTDATQTDTTKTDDAKADTTKTDTTKADTTKADTTKADTTKADTTKADTGTSNTAKADAGDGAAKGSASSADTDTTSGAQAQTAKTDALGTAIIGAVPALQALAAQAQLIAQDDTTSTLTIAGAASYDSATETFTYKDGDTVTGAVRVSGVGNATPDSGAYVYSGIANDQVVLLSFTPSAGYTSGISDTFDGTAAVSEGNYSYRTPAGTKEARTLTPSFTASADKVTFSIGGVSSRDDNGTLHFVDGVTEVGTAIIDSAVTPSAADGTYTFSDAAVNTHVTFTPTAGHSVTLSGSTSNGPKTLAIGASGATLTPTFAAATYHININGAASYDGYDGATGIATFTYKVGETSVGTVQVAGAGEFTNFGSGSVSYSTTSNVTVTVTPETGYKGSLSVDGNQVTLLDGAYSFATNKAADTYSLDPGFEAPASLTIGASDYSAETVGDEIQFKNGDTQIATLTATVSDKACTPISNVFTVPKDSHVKLTVRSSGAAYVPNITIGASQSSFQYDVVNGIYTFELDVHDATTATISFTVAPKLTVAAGAGSVAVNASHAFAFTSADATTLGNMTLTDGANPYVPAMGADTSFYLTGGSTLAVSIADVPAGYAPSLQLGNAAAIAPTFNENKYTYTFDHVTADSTLTVSFVALPKISITSDTAGVTTATDAGTLQFWNPNYSTTSVFATLTATDGQNTITPQPALNGALPYFFYPANKHLEGTCTVPTGYAPVVKNGTTEVSLWQSESNVYKFNIDNLESDATLTVSFTKLPAVTVATDAATNQMSVDANTGVFTFKNADGATTMATMTAQDRSGGESSLKGNPFYPANENVTLSITTTSKTFSPVVTGGGSGALQKDHDDTTGTKWFYTCTVTADTTLNVQILGGFMVTLPAAYDATYQSSYGTVEWSTSEGGTYQPITNGTKASTSTVTNYETGVTSTLYNYTFTSSQTVYIKATWPNGNPKGFTAMEAIGMCQGDTLTNGEAKQLIGSGAIQYDDWYTFSWAYDAEHVIGGDDPVKNGKIIIKSVSGGTNPERNKVSADGSGAEGLAFLSDGAQITIQFVPDAKYQFTGIKVNGEAIKGVVPSSELYTYTFTAKGMVHFSGSFDESEDIVSNTATKATKLGLANGANAVGNGNAVLNAADSLDVDNGIQVQMQSAAGDGATIQTILGLTLSRAVACGVPLTEENIAAGLAWVNQMTELEQPVTVSMVLDEGVVPDGQTVTVVRRHVNADGSTSITTVDCTYDAATRTLTFSSALFSDFAIATAPPTTDTSATANTGTSTSTKAAKTAKTGDDANPAMLYVAFGFLGAGCVLLVVSYVLRRREER